MRRHVPHPDQRRRTVGAVRHDPERTRLSWCGEVIPKIPVFADRWPDRIRLADCKRCIELVAKAAREELAARDAATKAKALPDDMRARERGRRPRLELLQGGKPGRVELRRRRRPLVAAAARSLPPA